MQQQEDLDLMRFHVVVIDGDGDITGNSGTILEKNLALSKAKDAEYSLGSPSYWRKFIANNSEFIFAGSQPGTAATTGFKSGETGFDLETDVGWDQNAEGITFAATGNSNNTLTDGLNYDGDGNVEKRWCINCRIKWISNWIQFI